MFVEESLNLQRAAQPVSYLLALLFFCNYFCYFASILWTKADKSFETFTGTFKQTKINLKD